MGTTRADQSLKYCMKVIEKQGQDKCQVIELERKIADRNYRLQILKMFGESSKVRSDLKTGTCSNESKPLSWGDSLFKTVNLMKYREDCKSKHLGRCKSMPTLHVCITSESEDHLPLIEVRTKQQPLQPRKPLRTAPIKSERHPGVIRGLHYNENKSESTGCLSKSLEKFEESHIKHTHTCLAESSNKNDFDDKFKGRFSSQGFLENTCVKELRRQETDHGVCDESKETDETKDQQVSKGYKKKLINAGWVDNTIYINRKSNCKTRKSKAVGRERLALPSIV